MGDPGSAEGNAYTCSTMARRKSKHGVRMFSMESQGLPGSGAKIFPVTNAYVEPNRRVVEEECRKLWDSTSDERKRKWSQSYVDESGSESKVYERPVIPPDEVFGPCLTDDPEKVTYATRISYFLLKPAQEVDRETTLIASFLGPRWGHIILDPRRSENEILEDVKVALPQLRQNAMNFQDLAEGVDEDHPKGRVDLMLDARASVDPRSKQRRRSRTSLMLGSLCYYHLLSGASYADTAARVFGSKQKTRNVDNAVQTFINQFEPGERWRSDGSS